MQDLQVSLDDLTEQQDSSLFNYKRNGFRPNEVDPDTIFSVNFSMENSLVLVERNLFTILDLLAEIGGL